MAFRQIYSSTPPASLEEFLRSGWIFALADGRLALGWGAMQWVAAADEHACAVFAPDFYLSTPCPWLVSEYWTIVAEPAGLAARLISGNAGPASGSGGGKTGVPEATTAVGSTPDALGIANPRMGHLDWQEPSPDQFAEVFSRISAAFADGTAQKAVPVVFATAEVTAPDDEAIAPLRRTLARALKPPSQLLRAYGFWTTAQNEDSRSGEPHRRQGLVGEGLLGLSPEVLFRLTNTGLETMALAGTRRGVLTSDEQASAFLNDPKEAHEHALVVADLRARLSRWGQVLTGPTGVMRLPTLSHLRTPLSVAFGGPEQAESRPRFEDVARFLHPTPALGVAPRALGLEWMKSWDQAERRRRFGAPFGVSLRTPQGESLDECLVAIRNVQWQDGAVPGPDPLRRRSWLLGSGCGVVPQSEFENEWHELFAKREAVRRALDI